MRNIPAWLKFLQRYIKGAKADTTLNTLTVNSWGDVPASATAEGTAGQMAYDSTHIYICVADDTWTRATIATW